jgi:hypothetical protein
VIDLHHNLLPTVKTAKYQIFLTHWQGEQREEEWLIKMEILKQIKVIF